MKTLYSIFLIILFSAATAIAQSLHIDSTRFVCGPRSGTQINYAIPTADKGILFVGVDALNPGGIIPYFPIDTVLTNVLIGKIDSNHQISWLKVYGGSEDDGAASVCKASDGGYAVLASTGSSNGDVTGYKGNGDLWLIKTDASGILLWEKCYGSSESDEPIAIANTPDHGFIMLGATNGSDGDVPFHHGDFATFDWFVVKIDNIGNKQWSRDIGTTGNESFNGSILAIDGGYYLISATDSSNNDCTDTAWHRGVYSGLDIYVIKLDSAGNILWDSSYGGSHGEGAIHAMYDPRDSTIMIAGWTFSGDYMVTGYQDGGDFWVLKINKKGTLLWEKTLGSPNQEGATGICPASAGGYMVYGRCPPRTNWE